MICIRSNITVFMMGMEKGISHLYGTVIFKEKELKNQLIAYSNRFGEGNGTPLQCSCLENPMDGGAWWAAVHGVAESRTRLSDFTFTFHFHALEKAMAPHSSVLAWRIPGTGEPGRLWSMGSLRVGHHSATSLSLFNFHALEKEMAAHSSVLAWRTPGTGEPGGLPSMGSHGAGHD